MNSSDREDHIRRPGPHLPLDQANHRSLRPETRWLRQEIEGPRPCLSLSLPTYYCSNKQQLLDAFLPESAAILVLAVLTAMGFPNTRTAQSIAKLRAALSMWRILVLTRVPTIQAAKLPFFISVPPIERKLIKHDVRLD